MGQPLDTIKTRLQGMPANAGRGTVRCARPPAQAQSAEMDQSPAPQRTLLTPSRSRGTPEAEAGRSGGAGWQQESGSPVREGKGGGSDAVSHARASRSVAMELIRTEGVRGLYRGGATVRHSERLPAH